TLGASPLHDAEIRNAISLYEQAGLSKRHSRQWFHAPLLPRGCALARHLQSSLHRLSDGVFLRYPDIPYRRAHKVLRKLWSRCHEELGYREWPYPSLLR